MPVMSDKGFKAFQDVTEYLTRCRLDKQDGLCVAGDIFAWVCLMVTDSADEAVALLQANAISMENCIRENAENVAKTKAMAGAARAVKN